MNLKAIIPSGMTEITVNGLHQWDYGRKLEIHSSGLPAVIEVHFACAGMKEAVVRSCSVTNGVAVAAIPDRCLEQTAPITAWVYEIDGTSGVTTVKMNLTVKPRTRPCPTKEIPTNISDKYTEAVTAMNSVIASVAAGNVTVARAIADANGKNIVNTYATQEEVHGETLYTDLYKKVEELVALHAFKVYTFRLAGASYETDESGKPINLPTNMSAYCFVTVYAYYGAARVILWGSQAKQPTYYNRYGESAGWSGWIPMMDAENIESFIPNTTSGLKLTGSTSAIITNGVGALATGVGLEIGAFYLVYFAGRSGTIYKSSSALNTATIGEYVIQVSEGEQSDAVTVWSSLTNSIANESGTMRFYKMGTVS